MPKDTPNAAYYTKVCDGGLGVFQYKVQVPALRKGCLERLKEGSDTRAARIAEALLRGSPPQTSKELRKEACEHQKAMLYASADGRGLSGADVSPPTHSWVDDGTRLMRGSTYISAIKTRLGVANTKMRASKGRPDADVACDLGCGRPESLGHVLQMCPVLAPERTKRHDNVLSLLCKHLEKRKKSILREPSIRTSAGVRKPDVVVWDDIQSVVLDVQVVSDNAAGDALARAHGLKKSYYDVGDIRDWVRERTGHPPVFATLTINWRGMMGYPSYMALKSLGLTKADLRLLTVRSLEGSVSVLRAHRDLGGWGR